MREARSLKLERCYRGCLSLLLGIFLICLAVTPASADTLFKGAFTVTTEVHWGNAVLPPGEYSMSLEDSMSAIGCTIVIRNARTNKPVTIVYARTESGAHNSDSSLLIAGPRDQRVVYSVRLAGFGEVFHELARKTPKEARVEEAVVIQASQTAGK
jgi:hypothetical protein